MKVLFTAREQYPDDDYYHETGYIGTFNNGDFSWSERIFDIPGKNNKLPSLCEILEDKQFLIGYDTDYNYIITRYDSTNGQRSSILWNGGDYYTEFWEELAVREDGIIITICNIYDYGLQLKKSTDYGETWSEAYNIDCLEDILGGENYIDTEYSTVQGFSIQCDKETGLFWMTVVYYGLDAPEEYILIANSSDGENWTTKKIIPKPIGDDWVVSLSVSNGNICVARPVYISETGNNRVSIIYSSDDGENWNESSIAENLDIDSESIKIVTNGTTAVLYVLDTFTDLDLVRVYRSTDKINWTEVLEITTNYSQMYPSHVPMSASGKYFAFTACQLQYPDTLTYKGTDNIEHTLEGEGTPVLGFFYSIDDRLTWNFATTPVDATKWWNQSLDILSEESNQYSIQITNTEVGKYMCKVSARVIKN